MVKASNSLSLFLARMKQDTRYFFPKLPLRQGRQDA